MGRSAATCDHSPALLRRRLDVSSTLTSDIPTQMGSVIDYTRRSCSSGSEDGANARLCGLLLSKLKYVVHADQLIKIHNDVTSLTIQ